MLGTWLLTQLEYAEFDEPGSQADRILDFYLLISVHKMVDKFPFLENSFNKCFYIMLAFYFY